LIEEDAMNIAIDIDDTLTDHLIIFCRMWQSILAQMKKD